MKEAEAQQVRWGPVDGKEAGISIVNGEFISWDKLSKEIETKILPQVEALNEYQSYYVTVEDFKGKKNWRVIINSNKEQIGGIWFGPDPEISGHPWDGLIRVGKSFNPPIIWNTFQRYSDGTYRRLTNKSQTD